MDYFPLGIDEFWLLFLQFRLRAKSYTTKIKRADQQPVQSE